MTFSFTVLAKPCQTILRYCHKDLPLLFFKKSCALIIPASHNKVSTSRCL